MCPVIWEKTALFGFVLTGRAPTKPKDLLRALQVTHLENSKSCGKECVSRSVTTGECTTHQNNYCKSYKSKEVETVHRWCIHHVFPV